MRILIPAIALIFIGYSFIQKPLPEKTLQVFFMQSFNNDSIRFSTSVSNDLRLRVRAQQSAQDTVSKMILQMSPQDTVICIRNITGQDSVKAKYRGERYLYVYYKAPKYTMRFSNKAIFVEWWPREIRDSVGGCKRQYTASKSYQAKLTGKENNFSKGCLIRDGLFSFLKSIWES